MIYVIPILFMALFVYCIIKKVPAYDYFTCGARSALNLVISIFPYLVAIFIFVKLLSVSGVSAIMCKLFSPALEFVGIPKELAELIILRPFSGNGSLAIVENIYNTYGADSYIGRCASVVIGASDTIFYVIAVYFSTVKIKKLSYILPVCLIACALGSISACMFVRLFM